MVKLEMPGVSNLLFRRCEKIIPSGFDLSHPATSVSMTINGPAPMLLGFFIERRNRPKL